jgi:chaperonin GroEL
MTKQLIFGDEARRRLKIGLDRVAEVVAVTLGPKGRNIALGRQSSAPLVTHDGAMVAGEIEWPASYENMGAQLLKEAATKTREAAGDGATTTMVLAQAMVGEGFKNIAAGANSMLLKRGLEKAASIISAAIKAQAIQLCTSAEIAHVAAISAQSREIGELIAGVLDRAGPDGAVTIEESNGLGIETEYVAGMQFKQGYLSPYFITHAEAMETILEEPYLLLCGQRISAAADLSPLLEKLTHISNHNLVVIADDVGGEALAMLVLTKLRGVFNLVAVKTPGFDHHRRATLHDIAILTGGTVISEETGRRLESATLADLGCCDKVVITKDETTLIDGHGDNAAIKSRINQIKTELEQSPRDYDQKKLQARLARLSGGVAIIKVGAATGVELKEKKQRVENALRATRTAVEAGIVPGGGVALLNAVSALDGLTGATPDEATAVNIVRRALAEPMRRIADNAGLEGAVIVANVRCRQQAEKNHWIGYDVISEQYRDMRLAGIIDPARVTWQAVENAASSAAMLLTIEVLVADRPE